MKSSEEYAMVERLPMSNSNSNSILLFDGASLLLSLSFDVWRSLCGGIFVFLFPSFFN